MTTAIQFPTDLLSGDFTATVQDNNGRPANVMEASLAFNVELSWTVSALTAALLGGQWEVAVYAEAMGPGTDRQIGSVTVTVNGATGYTARITVPGGTFTNSPNSPNSGVYKLLTVLSHRNFGRLSNLAAVTETGAIRFV